MKLTRLIILAFLSGLLLSSCFTKKPLVTIVKDSNEKPLPIEASEILARVVEVVPQTQAVLKSSPCAKAPCEAKIKIMQVLNTGQAFLPTLSRNDEVSVKFAYTLSPTDSIFVNSTTHLPGLKEGDIFKAHVRIIGQAGSGLNLYEVGEYEKQ